MKIGFLGDSITAGFSASSREKMYVSLVEKYTGFSCINYGISGSRIAPQINKKEPYDYCDFVSRSLSLDKDLDFLFVFGGTNDFGHGDAPFGDLNNKSSITFCGAFRTLINNLLTFLKKQQICFILPLPRSNQDCHTLDGINEKKNLVEYKEVMKSILAEYQIQSLDIFNGLKNEEVMNKYICEDGLHPSDSGHAFIAEKISNYLKHYLTE